MVYKKGSLNTNADCLSRVEIHARERVPKKKYPKTSKKPSKKGKGNRHPAKSQKDSSLRKIFDDIEVTVDNQNIDEIDTQSLAVNINPEEFRTALDDLDVHFDTFTETNAELQQKTRPENKIKILENILVNPERSESVH